MSSKALERLLAKAERKGTEARDRDGNTVLGCVLLKLCDDNYNNRHAIFCLNTVQKLLVMGADVNAYVYAYVYSSGSEYYEACLPFTYITQNVDLFYLQLFKMFLATGVPPGDFRVYETDPAESPDDPVELGHDHYSNFKNMLQHMLIEGSNSLDALDIKTINLVNLFLDADYEPDDDDLDTIVRYHFTNRNPSYPRRFCKVQDTFMIDLMISARF